MRRAGGIPVQLPMQKNTSISISSRLCGVEGVEYAADSCETAGDGSHFAGQQLGERHYGYISYLVTG